MIKISVCIGSACHLNGAHNVVSSFQHMIEDNNLHDKIELAASFCMKNCTNVGVSVKVDDKTFRITEKEARAFFKDNILPLVK